MFQVFRVVLFVTCVTGLPTGIHNIEQTGQFDEDVVDSFPDLHGIPFVVDAATADGHTEVLATPEQLQERGPTLFARFQTYTRLVTLHNETKPACEHLLGPPRTVEKVGQFILLGADPQLLRDPSFNAYQQTQNRAFTDTESATDNFWTSLAESSPAFVSYVMLRKVTPLDVPDLRRELDDRHVVDTSMYWLDLRDLDALPPQMLGSTVKHGVGAVILLEFGRSRQGTLTLRPKAVRLATLVDDTVMKQVFVYGQTTSSAWRFALLGAKTAFTQWAIGIVSRHGRQLPGTLPHDDARVAPIDHRPRTVSQVYHAV